MTALLELDRITKRFGQVTVAEELSLEVAAGEAVGIVGPNGAGKTSLFGVMSGDLAPNAGDVRFEGRSIRRLDPALRCRLGIGRTYQVPRPFQDMTVFENVLMAAQQGARVRGQAGNELAVSALERTGLRDHANRPAGELGLLQRKRLELARALATRPKLLLLDEVAGGLTDPEVGELVEIVRGVRREGVSVVWIEHVVRALTETVDRMICLAAGRIVGEGDPAAVLASPAVKEVFLGTEATAEALAEAGVGETAAPRGRMSAVVEAEGGAAPLLEVRDLTVAHGQLRALHDLDVRVVAGEVLAIIGANGAGKSTLLRTIAGLHRPLSGTVLLEGKDVGPLRPERRVAAGIALVPEGRRLFPGLTLEENLLIGTYHARPGPWTLERLCDLFRWMPERRRQRAWQLSGGEQQAVAIGRALVANPRLLLLDELSLGLAPLVVRQIYGILPELLASGMTVLLVEQDVSQAVRVASSIQCLLKGRTTLQGRPDEFTPAQIEAAYFGLAESAGA